MTTYVFYCFILLGKQQLGTETSWSCRHYELKANSCLWSPVSSWRLADTQAVPFILFLEVRGHRHVLLVPASKQGSSVLTFQSCKIHSVTITNRCGAFLQSVFKCNNLLTPTGLAGLYFTVQLEHEHCPCFVLHRAVLSVNAAEELQEKVEKKKNWHLNEQTDACYVYSSCTVTYFGMHVDVCRGATWTAQTGRRQQLRHVDQCCTSQTHVDMENMNYPKIGAGQTKEKLHKSLE